MEFYSMDLSYRGSVVLVKNFAAIINCATSIMILSEILNAVHRSIALIHSMVQATAVRNASLQFNQCSLFKLKLGFSFLFYFLLYVCI